jgi:hypothetical protein
VLGESNTGRAAGEDLRALEHVHHAVGRVDDVVLRQVVPHVPVLVVPENIIHTKKWQQCVSWNDQTARMHAASEWEEVYSSNLYTAAASEWNWEAEKLMKICFQLLAFETI